MFALCLSAALVTAGLSGCGADSGQTADATADNGYFLYYNKAYFSEEDIQDLDTILDVAAKNDKLSGMDWSSDWYLYSFFGQTGLKVGLNDDGVTNFCDWNNTKREIKGTDVAEALLKIAANPGFKSTADWIEGIKSGDVIACVSGVWDESAIKEAWGSNYGAAKLPCYTVAGQKVQMACYFGYKMIGVNLPPLLEIHWRQVIRIMWTFRNCWIQR